MPSYPLLCYQPECEEPAVFKIAARWSDGVTEELKTYFLTCAGCVALLFAQAQLKQAACRLVPGETLDAPGIYDLDRGKRDRQLIRRLEQEVLAEKATRRAEEI